MRRFKRKIAQVLSGVGAGVITATTLLPGAAGATETLFSHVGETLEVETGDTKEYIVDEEKIEVADKSINDEDVYSVSFTEKTPVIEEKDISIEDGEVVGNTEDEKEMALIGDGILDKDEETTIAAAIKKLEAESEDVSYADVQSIVWTVETEKKVYPVETINMEALEKVYASIENGSVMDAIAGMDVTSISAKSDKNDYVVFYYLPQVTEVQETVEVEAPVETPVETPTQETEGKLVQEIAESVKEVKQEAVKEIAVTDSATTEISETVDVDLEKEVEVDKKQKAMLKETKYGIPAEYLVISKDSKATGIDDMYKNSPDDFITQFSTEVRMYDDGSDYLVGFINAQDTNSAFSDIIDYAAGLNDVSGTEVESEFKDGTIRIPKKYFTEEQTNNVGETPSSKQYPVKAQFMVRQLEERIESDIKVDIVNENTDVETVDVKSIKADAFDMSISIPVVTSDTASNISLDNIDVFINNSKDTLVKDIKTLNYDKETGILTIAQSSVAIDNVTIKISNPAKIESSNVFEGSYKGINVKATAENGAFPEGTTMVLGDADPVNVENIIKMSGVNVSDSKSLDVSFFKDGKEIEPGKCVNIEMTFDAALEGDRFAVFHMDEENGVELTSTNASNDEVEFITDSFSDYVIIAADGSNIDAVGKIKVNKDILNSIASGQLLDTTCNVSYDLMSWHEPYDIRYNSITKLYGTSVGYSANIITGLVNGVPLGQVTTMSGQDGYDDNGVKITRGFYEANTPSHPTVGTAYMFDITQSLRDAGLISGYNDWTNYQIATGTTDVYGNAWAHLPLFCAHTRVSGLPNASMGSNKYTTGGPMKVRVLTVNKDAAKPYVVLGFYTGTFDNNAQEACAIYKFDIESEPDTTNISLKKVSADPSITNGNDCYSLAGGEFGVYESEADANQDKNRVGTFITKADGTSDTISNLPMKTYYVKEVKAPKGFKINTEVKTVEAKAETNTVEFADEPGKDPNRLSVIKKDAGSDTPLDMSGAEFTLYYYPNSKWEGEPTETVKATTQKLANGKCVARFDIELPAGSYMVKETKAPTGYKINPKEFKGQIVVNDDGTVSAESIGVVEQDAGAQVLVNESRDERVIKTTATDKNTGVHSGVTGTTTITDIVSYKNLYEGKTYTMKGTLMDKATGEPLTINGKTFVITKEFTPNKPDGTVALDFNVPTSSLAGKSTVVFEELYAKGSITDSDKPVSEHKDIDDKEQEVKFPSVGTKAVDKNSTIQSGVNGKTTYTDTVSYTNLQPGSTYKVSGILMDKETGEELKINGKTVTATKTFECTEENGNVKVDFNIDASSLAGKSVVVFEKLFIVKNDGTEVEVAKHENINDGKQEIATPKVRTSAEDFQTKNHTAVVGKTVLKDTVKYTNLIPNKKYTISGTLMDKETGKPIQVDGKNVKSKVTEFTPTERNGSVVIEFEVDTSTLQGKKTVVFEDLFYEGVKLTSHADINDKEQGIDIPKIRTTAIDGETQNHTGITGITTIVDTVKYENLTIGQEYIMEGIVMDKATGKELKVNGKTVTASQKFTPQKSQNGTVEITFNIDASELKGKDVVVFETLLQGKLKITEHTSINDKGQTVNYPEVRTKAINKETQNQTNVIGKTTIIDTVSYKNLTPGQKYIMQGKLVDKSTGEFLKNEKGEEIVNRIEFEAKEATGTVEVPLDVDTTLLQGKKIVVFEKLYQNEIEVTAHEDLEDIPQNTEVPTMGTTATDIQTGNHTGVAGVSTIVDEVKYTGLTIGQSYILKGVLMDKETGEPVVIDGKEVVSEQAFTVGEDIEYTHPSIIEKEETEEAKEDSKDETKDKTKEESKEEVKEDTKEETAEAETEAETEVAYEGIKGVTTDGSVKLFYDLDATELKGRDVVVFETLYQVPETKQESEEPAVDKETETTEEAVPVKVISHEDIEDEGQTVHIPGAHTTATDKNTETHTAVVGKTTIVDKVEFTGLTIGESYTFKGVLMDKETGEPIMQDGKEVTAEAVLEKAEAANGSQLLEFEVDASLIAGRSVVAFEEVYYKDVMITAHKDLKDDEQTVNVPTIATTATGRNGKTVEYGSSVTIVDTVSYTNLTVGENYTISGQMVDQNGNAVSNVESKPFKAESANGTVDVEFVVDTTGHAGQKLVAFEELKAENGTKITEHKDLTDEGQTVYVKNKPESPVPPTTYKNTPSTGNKSGVVIAAGIAAGAAAVAAAGLALSKKRKKEN